MSSNAWPARLQQLTVPYAGTDPTRSVRQLCNSAIPYFALLWLMHRSLAYPYWVTLALAVPTSGFLVRLFIIMHDCSHGSFFGSRKANDVLGILTGILLFTPYYGWRRRHMLHHATSSDLDRRGWWDITTLTVGEYLQLSPLRRFGYRLYRHPLVLFGLGPLAFFLIIQRFCTPEADRRERRNVRMTNLAILGLVAASMWFVGPWDYVLIQLPVLFLSAGAGLWLFYVQHQFEAAHWTGHGDWDFVGAALAGSSYYRLPRILQWFTGSIGFHHIHHLNPRIPNYFLQRCHDENPELRCKTTVTLWSSRRALSCRLWDEDSQRMVSFKEIHTHRVFPRLTLLPLIGSVGGRLIARGPVVEDTEIPVGRSVSPGLLALKIVVDDKKGAPADVGSLVKKKFFADKPGFVFNVCFSRGPGRSYCDPHSIWFNVFAGYYEITVPRSWDRPFGYSSATDTATVEFEELVRIGKADWNYFSNYMYGVPLRHIEPFDRLDAGPVKCATLGRERIEGGQWWDVVELDEVEVVSAYVSGADSEALESPSLLLSPLWRLSFGPSCPRPTHPRSFIPTNMRARLYISFTKSHHPVFGESYTTHIFGGTANNAYPDPDKNIRFLDMQMCALRSVIRAHYPTLGFRWK